VNDCRDGAADMEMAWAMFMARSEVLDQGDFTAQPAGCLPARQPSRSHGLLGDGAHQVNIVAQENAPAVARK
jgi:hypothetical protein